MKYIGKTQYKPLETKQTSLFEERQQISNKVTLQPKQGLPNWFWQLAKECKSSRC